MPEINGYRFSWKYPRLSIYFPYLLMLVKKILHSFGFLNLRKSYEKRENVLPVPYFIWYCIFGITMKNSASTFWWILNNISYILCCYVILYIMIKYYASTYSWILNNVSCIFWQKQSPFDIVVTRGHRDVIRIFKVCHVCQCYYSSTHLSPSLLNTSATTVVHIYLRPC